MSESKPVLRPMQKADVNRVHEIECTCFRSPWSRDALMGELRNEVAHYEVLDLDGTIIGYAGMWILFEEAHITNVAILPEYRKNGYGEQLMRGMMELAALLKATQMTLEVREHNDTAQRLYARLGFLQNGCRKRYYSDTGEAALLLWNRDILKTIAEKPLQFGTL